MSNRQSSSDTSSWPWWWSHDEECYHGPCHSRSGAIMEAWSDYPEKGYVHLAQAIHGDLRTDIFDSDRLQEQFDEANEEVQDPDGNALSEQIPVKEWSKLAKRFGDLLAETVRQNGVRSWGFTEMTGVETVDLTLPELGSLPADAKSIIAELAMGWSTEFPWSDIYMDDLIGQLKRRIQESRVVAVPTE